MGNGGIGDGARSGHINGLVGGPGVRVVTSVGEADELATRVHGSKGGTVDRGPSADNAGGVIGARRGDTVIRGNRPRGQDEVDRAARLAG